MSRGPKREPVSFQVVTKGELPEPPSWLPEGALDLWADIVPRLADEVALTKIDAAALADLVICQYRLNACESDIEERGVTVESRDRGPVKNPNCTLSRQYREALQKWFSRFGLTPADRKGLAGAPKENKSPLESAREKLNSAATATVQ